MQCPICDSPNAKMEQRKSSFLGSLFGAKPSGPRVTCSCTNCRQIWGVDERDGSIWETDRTEVAKAREDWLQRRRLIAEIEAKERESNNLTEAAESKKRYGPDIVCNGYPSGAGAEVTGFNEKANAWLKANVKSGRWILDGQCMQVPMSEVSQLVANATKDGLQVRTNNI